MATVFTAQIRIWGLEWLSMFLLDNSLTNQIEEKDTEIKHQWQYSELYVSHPVIVDRWAHNTCQHNDVFVPSLPCHLGWARTWCLGAPCLARGGQVSHCASWPAATGRWLWSGHTSTAHKSQYNHSQAHTGWHLGCEGRERFEEKLKIHCCHLVLSRSQVIHIPVVKRWVSSKCTSDTSWMVLCLDRFMWTAISVMQSSSMWPN